MLLSGGIDSTTALASVIRKTGLTEALFLAFGQPAELEEAKAARAVSKHYGVSLREVQIPGQTFTAGEIRGRNAFLIHLGLLLCPSEPAIIVIGIHAGTSYRDCSPEFIELMRRSMEFHSEGAIAVIAPFVNWSKGDVFAYARELDAPVRLTYSCELGGSKPCGSCLSCRDRELLFARAE